MTSRSTVVGTFVSFNFPLNDAVSQIVVENRHNSNNNNSKNNNNKKKKTNGAFQR